MKRKSDHRNTKATKHGSRTKRLTDIASFLDNAAGRRIAGAKGALDKLFVSSVVDCGRLAVGGESHGGKKRQKPASASIESAFKGSIFPTARPYEPSLLIPALDVPQSRLDAMNLLSIYAAAAAQDDAGEFPKHMVDAVANNSGYRVYSSIITWSTLKNAETHAKNHDSSVWNHKVDLFNEPSDRATVRRFAGLKWLPFRLDTEFSGLADADRDVEIEAARYVLEREGIDGIVFQRPEVFAEIMKMFSFARESETLTDGKNPGFLPDIANLIREGHQNLVNGVYGAPPRVENDAGTSAAWFAQTRRFWLFKLRRELVSAVGDGVYSAFARGEWINAVLPSETSAGSSWAGDEALGLSRLKEKDLFARAARVISEDQLCTVVLQDVVNGGGHKLLHAVSTVMRWMEAMWFARTDTLEFATPESDIPADVQHKIRNDSSYAFSLYRLLDCASLLIQEALALLSRKDILWLLTNTRTNRFKIVENAVLDLTKTATPSEDPLYSTTFSFFNYTVATNKTHEEIEEENEESGDGSFVPQDTTPASEEYKTDSGGEEIAEDLEAVASGDEHPIPVVEKTDTQRKSQRLKALKEKEDRKHEQRKEEGEEEEEEAEEEEEGGYVPLPDDSDLSSPEYTVKNLENVPIRVGQLRNSKTLKSFYAALKAIHTSLLSAAAIFLQACTYVSITSGAEDSNGLVTVHSILAAELAGEKESEPPSSYLDVGRLLIEDLSHSNAVLIAHLKELSGFTGVDLAKTLYTLKASSRKKESAKNTGTVVVVYNKKGGEKAEYEDGHLKKYRLTNPLHCLDLMSADRGLVYSDVSDEYAATTGPETLIVFGRYYRKFCGNYVDKDLVKQFEDVPQSPAVHTLQPRRRPKPPGPPVTTTTGTRKSGVGASTAQERRGKVKRAWFDPDAVGTAGDDEAEEGSDEEDKKGGAPKLYKKRGDAHPLEVALVADFFRGKIRDMASLDYMQQRITTSYANPVNGVAVHVEPDKKVELNRKRIIGCYEGTVCGFPDVAPPGSLYPRGIKDYAATYEYNHLSFSAQRCVLNEGYVTHEEKDSPAPWVIHAKKYAYRIDNGVAAGSAGFDRARSVASLSEAYVSTPLCVPTTVQIAALRAPNGNPHERNSFVTLINDGRKFDTDGNIREQRAPTVYWIDSGVTFVDTDVLLNNPGEDQAVVEQEIYVDYGEDYVFPDFGKRARSV